MYWYFCLFVCLYRSYLFINRVIFFFLGKWTFLSSFWMDRLWFGLDFAIRGKSCVIFPSKLFRFVNERFAWVKTKCSENWREIREGGGKGCVMAEKRVPSSENYGSFCLLLTFVNGLSLLFYLVSCWGKQSLSCCLACQQQHGHASLQGANSFTEKDICLK